MRAGPVQTPARRPGHTARASFEASSKGAVLRARLQSSYPTAQIREITVALQSYRCRESADSQTSAEPSNPRRETHSLSEHRRTPADLTIEHMFCMMCKMQDEASSSRAKDRGGSRESGGCAACPLILVEFSGDVGNRNCFSLNSPAQASRAPSDPGLNGFRSRRIVPVCFSRGSGGTTIVSR